ncbi:hypothetical protein [Aquimonas voraii]|uniref:Uncharacterized protein n=1 Tax=Aquimonas voraii TaxID=265719 RepID=A0A1G6XB77_9GAMM|nr:hypothetical protein [Aquimonas voraii]SDD74597.1 hypothetical protein SAMN04488509_106103 [Aquimonas voraii]
MQDLKTHETDAVGGGDQAEGRFQPTLTGLGDGGPVVRAEALPPPFEYLPVEPVRPPVFY